MIIINLIPQNKKKEFNLNKKIKIYFSFLNIIIINFLMYALIFFVLGVIMQRYYNDTKNQAVLIDRSTKNYSEEVKIINEKIEYISNIQNNFVHWYKFFIFLSDQKPKGVIYKQIKISKKENLVIFYGIAKTRDSLLNFKNKLENSGILSNINLPFSSLLKKNDINFEIQVNIDSYEF